MQEIFFVFKLGLSNCFNQGINSLQFVVEDKEGKVERRQQLGTSGPCRIHRAHLLLFPELLRP